MTGIEETLMKIAAKAWKGATWASLNNPTVDDADAMFNAFREIQALADAELAAIAKAKAGAP